MPLHDEACDGVLIIGSNDLEKFQGTMRVELLANSGEILSFM